MQFRAIILALMAATGAAFVPSTAKFSAVTRVSSPRTITSMGYVPDGLTPAQYKKLQAEEAKKKQDNKKKMKGSVETLTQWQARSAEKFKNQPGAGHVYVKIRGGELGDKKAAKGDYSSQALVKDGFGRGVAGKDKLKGAAPAAPKRKGFFGR